MSIKWKAFGGTMANKKKYTPAKTGGVAKLIMIWVVNAYMSLCGEKVRL